MFASIVLIVPAALMLVFRLNAYNRYAHYVADGIVERINERVRAAATRTTEESVDDEPDNNGLVDAGYSP